MDYLKPVMLYDISIVTGHTELEITQQAKAHSQKLHMLIKQHELR